MQKVDLAQFDIPDKPGVYFFKKGEEILYIGKATSLQSRVRSYFSDDLIRSRGMLLVDMVIQADTISWKTTDSVLEALIYESQLIKKNQPYYNSKEKDDKSYTHVVITHDALPRVFTERAKTLQNTDKLNYSIRSTFGPYTNGPSIREALRIIRKILPYRTRKSGNKHSDRFYSQLGLLPDVSDSSARKRYLAIIEDIELFLSGKKHELIKRLSKKMQMAADAHDFEYAAILRNRVRALEHINDISMIKHDLYHMKGLAGLRIEAYDIAHLQGDEIVGVMTVIEDGDVKKSDYRKFIVRGFDSANDPGALREVLERRLRHDEWPLPDIMVMDGGKVQYQVGKRVIEEYKDLFRDQKKPRVISVVKDEKHKPKELLGGKRALARVDKRLITLANNEAHRFALSFHQSRMRKRQTEE